MKWDLRFLQLAKLVSSWSKDPSTKVGSVIVRPDKTVASLGFNGFPVGHPDDLESYNNRDIKYKIMIHAEKNAISFAKEPLNGYTVYVYPFPPCSTCAQMLIKEGIKRCVAYKLLPSDKERYVRWEPDFAITRKLFQEAGIELIEVEGDLCQS